MFLRAEKRGAEPAGPGGAELPDGCERMVIKMAMPEEKKTVRKVHNIIIEDRKSLTVSGVEDVDSFDEQTVVLFTELGELTVRGSDLHMNKLNVETGEVSIEGEIQVLSYQDETPRSSGGIFGRIFR